MKKITLLILFSFLTIQITNAQDIENTQKDTQIQTKEIVSEVITTPTDEEILEIIETYHLNPSQKEQVLKETKRRLKEMNKEMNKETKEK